MVIHVILISNIDKKLNCLTVSQLNENGKHFVDTYSIYQKGAVIIYCTSLTNYDRLATLISSVILSDHTSFSGQTFFL